MERARGPSEGVSTCSEFAALVGEGAEFFERFWERQPLLSAGALQRMEADLVEALPSFDNMLALIHTAEQFGGDYAAAMCFKDQHPTLAYPSPAAAYLDGCSIIVNHAEAASDGVARLCRALRRQFPHAFGNLYLTPPRAQAVDAHADDRDVLVLQLEGAKRWTVYSHPPIPFPSRDEQVGKEERLPVPEEAVLEANVALRATLHKGDCLYVPRGYVHEASTGEVEPSLHLTLALPSDDWCWASLIAEAAAEATAEAAAEAAMTRRSRTGRSRTGRSVTGRSRTAPRPRRRLRTDPSTSFA